MVQISLECAIVGQPGTFDVMIDDGKKVSKLKKKIKKEKMYEFPAGELQLFLAKTAGGAWLDGAGVAAVTVDEAGAVPGILDEHGNHNNFVIMNPTLWIKNDEHFGENFQPGEGQVHVLVMVPEGAVGSALLQQMNSGTHQDAMWYGTRGSVGSGEGINLEDPRTLARATLTANIIHRLEETGEKPTNDWENLTGDASESIIGE